MTRRRVITEREIQRSARAGDGSIDVTGAVVTPSARDEAVRAKITLTDANAPPPRTAARRVNPEPPKPATVSTKTPASAPPSREKAGAGPSGAPRAAVAPSEKSLTVALGADHGGVSMKAVIAERLRELGHAVLDFGTVTKDPVDYPDFAIAVAKAVAEGRATVGVMIDGAGIGSCMVANKVRGVRAAMCYDVTTAANAREHNNANVLTLGAGLIGNRLATAILETFLATPFSGGRHKPRVDKIDALDRPG
jgi:ribose 5-phosphate isomerase B